jgi:hypothetical protein
VDLLHLVDRLEELVAAAQKMPIGSRAIVDRRRVLDIVDQMRIAIPQEVRDAQEMVARREQLLREAEEEARMVVARAEQRAARMAEDHEIATAARQRAQEIAVHAESRLEERIAEANADIQERLAESRRIADQEMTAADDYARELLERLANQLRAFVRSVEAGVEQLQPPEPPPAVEGTPSTSSIDDAPADAREGTADDDREISDPVASRASDEGSSQDALGDRVAAPLSLRQAVAEEEMESVLQRPDREGPMPSPPPAETGVIDDFDLPSLDDDPTQPQDDARERG